MRTINLIADQVEQVKRVYWRCPYCNWHRNEDVLIKVDGTIVDCLRCGREVKLKYKEESR